MSEADQERISGAILEFMPRDGSSLDEIALEPLRSTVSLPFEPGENRKAAVKTAGDRGIEPLKVLPVSE